MESREELLAELAEAETEGAVAVVSAKADVLAKLES